MDYAETLLEAYKNSKDAQKKEMRCYVTEFLPPKKRRRPSVPTDNIKKFLAKREEDESKKRQEEDIRKEKLLVIRNEDKMAKRRVKSMLTLTKSAMKSVIDDAVDPTIGFKQCDEDDYGFTSKEASEMYANIVKKYIEEPQKTITSAPQVIKVKCKLPKKTEGGISNSERPKEENTKMLTPVKTEDKDNANNNESITKNDVNNSNPSKKSLRTRGPPPISYEQLLLLAKQKQSETFIVHKPLSQNRKLQKNNLKFKRTKDNV